MPTKKKLFSLSKTQVVSADNFLDNIIRQAKDLKRHFEIKENVEFVDEAAFINELNCFCDEMEAFDKLTNQW